MTHLPEIWSCIKLQIPKGSWIPIEDIYNSMQKNLTLDAEDFMPQSPISNIPKWKRNVRNVLQYRKNTGELEWDGAAKYRI